MDVVLLVMASYDGTVEMISGDDTDREEMRNLLLKVADAAGRETEVKSALLVELLPEDGARCA